MAATSPARNAAYRGDGASGAAGGAMIRLERVGKRYDGGHDALRDLDLAVERGEMVFLTGRSGAGKSTLLKLIALIERPTRGQLLVGGVNVGRLRPARVPAYRRQLGIIFQDHKLLCDRTVFDNVALPLVIAGAGRRDIERRVGAALDQVGLARHGHHYPLALSTGEQQRVGIARAVVSRPPLLIADEPTGNLDPQLSFEIMKLFLRFNEVGVTVLVASHDTQLIGALGRRVVTLADGTLAGDTAAAGTRSGPADAGGGQAPSAGFAPLPPVQDDR
jgi:cell division transport system ATP-binding protein